jgi:hypothetical protein
MKPQLTKSSSKDFLFVRLSTTKRLLKQILSWKILRKEVQDVKALLLC